MRKPRRKALPTCDMDDLLPCLIPRLSDNTERLFPTGRMISGTSGNVRLIFATKLPISRHPRKTQMTIAQGYGHFTVELSRLCIKFVEKKRHPKRVPSEKSHI
ncbi:hypothetical protein [Roseinatronobacter alkalisoli]|uniref:Uncharacterized protein n=1 Tax=Roseinatronobacter alkalisoli TaxID=3028235 RepID=A0ABT5T9X3_9RHOB|nr:hypothetical protein [Roseinatronobacter sp. HJB301]MDD7971923.1 hypothetical protein [Roseinatronobacter sp. HJB301]